MWNIKIVTSYEHLAIFVVEGSGNEIALANTPQIVFASAGFEMKLRCWHYFIKKKQRNLFWVFLRIEIRKTINSIESKRPCREVGMGFCLSIQIHVIILFGKQSTEKSQNIVIYLCTALDD